MAHCGYEATAVEDMLKHPIKAFLTSLRGPKTEGEMAPEPKPDFITSSSISSIPVKVEITE